MDELQSRLAELPEDEEIVTHCRTGLRAEMGPNILRNARLLSDKATILKQRLFCCFKQVHENVPLAREQGGRSHFPSAGAGAPVFIP